MRTKRARKLATAILNYRAETLARRKPQVLYKGIPEWIWGDNDKRRKYLTLPVERQRIREAYAAGRWVGEKLVEATRPRHRIWRGRKAYRKLWSLASRSRTRISRSSFRRSRLD